MEHLGHTPHEVAVLEVPAGEVLRERAEEVLEGLGVRVGVDEDEPAPGADLGLRQLPLRAVRLDARELAEGRGEAERPVEPPGEAVEAAPELAAAAVVVLERPPAVQAGVDEGLDAVACADDDVAVASDVVEDVAAD